MSKLAPIYIAIGSNEGNRLRECKLALHFLKNINTQITPTTSAIYESEPLGPSDQMYLNAVCRLQDCTLSPFELLKSLKAYEYSRGRNPNAPKWSSRPIDLDILFMGQLVVQSKNLIIPHTQILDRSFVLVPLLSLKDSEYGYYKRAKLIQQLETLDLSSLSRTHYSWI